MTKKTVELFLNATQKLESRVIRYLFSEHITYCVIET